MFKGTVKKLIRDRGFGFISADDGREIFFHRSAVVGIDFDSLHEGDAVTFGVEKGDKGPKAINVTVAEIV
ncbi:MAG: cold-shock protein [Nitrospinae bacterium RIFCSPLOWO2_12_FULL_45_22]|nr:MAG: cold-shock protein [Nitrospinae bacterium RIFCSPLOWO2_12_FULL_45_22]